MKRLTLSLIILMLGINVADAAYRTGRGCMSAPTDTNRQWKKKILRNGAPCFYPYGGRTRYARLRYETPHKYRPGRVEREPEPKEIIIPPLPPPDTTPKITMVKPLINVDLVEASSSRVNQGFKQIAEIPNVTPAPVPSKQPQVKKPSEALRIFSTIVLSLLLIITLGFVGWYVMRYSMNRIKI